MSGLDFLAVRREEESSQQRILPVLAANPVRQRKGSSLPRVSVPGRWEAPFSDTCGRASAGQECRWTECVSPCILVLQVEVSAQRSRFGSRTGALQDGRTDGPGGFTTIMAYLPAHEQVFLGFTNSFGYFNEVDFMMDEVVGPAVGER
jgi:hypothetical protein